jgi:hypothetical protein
LADVLRLKDQVPGPIRRLSNLSAEARKVFNNAVSGPYGEREPNSKHKIEYTIQNGLTVPQDDGYRELMSGRVFKRIAKKIAPWRLENGR